MRISLKTVSYTVLLFASLSAQAAGTDPLQALAEEHGRQSVAAAQRLVRAELNSSMARVPVPVSAEVREPAARFAVNTESRNAIARTR
ncbi:MAG TPA: hypothetical protein VIC61_05630 [Gammaproteobacteria bacterium]